jgi:SAM-dependent methyltransferase
MPYPSPPAQPQSAVSPLDDVGLLADWLSDITQSPRSAVLRRLDAECRRIGHNVREAARDFGVRPHVWSERLVEFYASTDSFLYETAVWNGSANKQTLRSRTGRVLTDRLPARARVLMFGDGMGFDSAHLAGLGLDVDCYEISAPCIEFASRLMEHNSCEVRMISEPPADGCEQYDAVVCLDVLEHVPDPGALVRQFRGWINPEGRLVVHAPFFDVGSLRPTHLRSNRRFAGRTRPLYRDNGFRVEHVSGCFFSPICLRRSDARRRTRLGAGNRLRLALGTALMWPSNLIPFVYPAATALAIRTPPWRSQIARLLRTSTRAQLQMTR